RVLGFNEELAAVGHGVTGVDGDVENDLLEMRFVDDNGAGGTQVQDQFNVFADQPRQDSGEVTQHLVRLNRRGPGDLLAAEGEQLPGQPAGALRGVDNLGAVATVILVVAKLGL